MIDATLSKDEYSDDVSGAQTMYRRGGLSTLTLQLIPAMANDEFTVVLEGSAARDGSGGPIWSNVGTFAHTETERIFVVDVTAGASYRIGCTAGTNVRCVLVG